MRTLALIYILASGTTLGQQIPIDTLVAPTPEERIGFGTEITTVNDLNYDGVDDFIITGFGDAGDPTTHGTIYVYRGSDRTLLYSIRPPSAQEYSGFGSHHSALPDVDGDGAGDFVVSASSEDVVVDGVQYRSAGRVYVYSGRSGEPLYKLQ